MHKTRSALGTGRLFACSAAVLLWSLVALRAAPLEAQPAQSRAFIECDREELIRAVPELASMQFESTQDRLPGLLAPAAENLEGMFVRLVDVAATEQIHEMRFEDGAESPGRWETYRYLVRRLAEGLPEPFTELRVGPDPNAPTPAPADGFLVIAHFEKLLRYLLPQYRQDSRFRYLGRVQEAGQGSWLGLVAFAQRADSVQPLGNIQLRGGRIATMQGLVWIDEATHRIVRLRVDLTERIEGSPFETLSTDIAFVAVKFPSIDSALWLPARVTIHGQEEGADLHTVHRYSDYQLDGRGAPAATMVATASGADDPWEMLDRGISLGRENKLPESIALLRGALRLNPEMAAARYHLAASLRVAGDFAGAEDALREALRRAPESGPTHNLLGLILFKRGDVAGAVAELRASLQLQPKDAIVHFNLARVLEKVDAKSALDEYRVASTLAPDNAAIKVGYEQFERAATAAAEQAATGATIKVEVRQVLVPVVVRDKEGHQVSGLTQADFHVFEDGVEQKISSFAVENAGVGSAVPAATGSKPPPAAGGVTSPAPPAQTQPAARVVRRTYLICIDSLNSKFANIVHVRAALSKLFAAELAGDAQYMVVAIGARTQVMQGLTTDPAEVLKAIESKDFQKLFLASRASSMEQDLQEFLRALDRTIIACDKRDPICDSMMRALQAQASGLASEERAYTLAFLDQFHHIVEELARGTGRRTIVLCSDGFQLVPGKDLLDLLRAAFSGSRIQTPLIEQMNDLGPVLHLAANHNIQVYTIDSRGLYTQGYFDVENAGSTARGGTIGAAEIGVMNDNARAASDTLSLIAETTGGTAFRNSNDIFAGLERAFADGRQYYELAYASSNSNLDGTFRAISVQVGDSKLSVLAKRGYWATGDPGGR
jgi:VWFA-related protein